MFVNIIYYFVTLNEMDRPHGHNHCINKEWKLVTNEHVNAIF